jgi:hypothetical protein
LPNVIVLPVPKGSPHKAHRYRTRIDLFLVLAVILPGILLALHGYVSGNMPASTMRAAGGFLVALFPPPEGPILSAGPPRLGVTWMCSVLATSVASRNFRNRLFGFFV